VAEVHQVGKVSPDSFKAPGCSGSDFLALVLLFPLLSCAEGPIAGAEAGNTLQEGKSLYEQKEYGKAREVFLHLTQLHPRSAEAFFYLGISEARLGDLAQAEDSLRRALKLDPSSVSVSYNLGVVLLDEKKPAEGAPYLELAYRKGPASPELAANLVRCYLDLRKSDQAVAVAEIEAQRYHDLPAFHLAVGKFFASHGLTAQARTFLETANRLAPSSPEIVIPLAEVYLQERDSVHALRLLEGISSSSQKDAYFHFLLGQGHFLAGQKEAALAQMAQAVQLDNRNPALLLTLARYYQKYGNQQKAVGALEKAARLDPRLAEVPYSLAVSYFIADDYDTAASYLDKAIQLQPDFDRAVFLLGSVRAAQGKFDEAQQVLGRAIQMQPENPFYACTLGMVLVTENSLDEASGYLQKSLTLRPTYALAHYQMGRLLARRQEYEKAREELEKAVALQPDLVEAWYQLSQVYRRLGMNEKAEQAGATFRQHRSTQYSERQEILRQVQDAIKSQP
jgi:tetratricopeptide (TPR) repeat protein